MKVCVSLSVCVCVCVCVSDRRGQPTIRDVDFGDGGQKSRRSSGLRFQFNHIYFLSRLWILAKVLIAQNKVLQTKTKIQYPNAA